MKAMGPEIRVNPQRNRSSSRDSDNGFFCDAETKRSTHVLVDGALVTALVPVDSAITITPTRDLARLCSDTRCRNITSLITWNGVQTENFTPHQLQHATSMLNLYNPRDPLDGIVVVKLV